MDISPEQEEHFKFIYNFPTTDHIRRLTPLEFEQFIAYLFARDGLYHPKLVGGPGDGGVDIELYARDENPPRLCGLVQCKRRLLDNVAPAEIAPLIVAAITANIDRRYVFSTSGFTGPARASARTSDVHLFDCSDIRFWIQDIRRRESILSIPHQLPDLDQMGIPIICITNNKGGVGKTTITGNLASALATDQHGVLVIDADPQGHLTLWMTAQRRYAARLSLHAVLVNEVPIHPLIQRTTENGVWILPSSRDLNELPNGLNPWILERRLAYAIANLPLSDPPIRYIVIDTPPGLSVLTRAAILAATSLLIPLQFDLFSLEGLDALLDFIEHSEAVHQKKPLHILGGVATVVDMRFRWGFKFRDSYQLARRPRLLASGLIGERFWCGLLRNRGDFKKAQADQHSVLRSPRSDAARDVLELAREVRKRVPVSANADD